MVRLAQRVRALQGWKGALASFLAGLVAVAAMPPVSILPALLIAFPVALWRLDGARSLTGALGTGFLFGLGHFIGLTYWVGFAFLVDAEEFGALAPVAVLGLATLLAVIPALVFGATRLLRARGPGRVLLFAGLWTLGELLREYYLSGFPWAPIGLVWMPVPAMIQSFAVFGVSGLSLLTVFAASAFATSSDEPDDDPQDRPLWRRYGRMPVAGLLLLALVATLGAGRLALNGGGGHWDDDGRWHAGESMAGNDGKPLFRARLVQPAIPQDQKWSATRRYENIQSHVLLSRMPGHDEVDAVIWAETAVSFALNTSPELRRYVARAAPENGLLITGGLRQAESPDSTFQVWNSLFVLDARGTILASYDKAHLVPFGEYIPFSGLPGVRKLTAGMTDFSAGPGLRTLRPGRLPPFSPLVCYEVIFPSRVIAREGSRPEWIANVTNDGWYGHTTGPYQHFQIARARAVEEGLPLVRVANTGISGVVSPLGVVSPVLGLDVAGFLDVDIPPPTGSTPPFGRFGNWIPLFLGLLFCVSGYVIIRNSRV